MSDLARPVVLVVAAALLLTSCIAAVDLSELHALGVQPVRGSDGWYALRSDRGFTFRMPGPPLAAREDYVFAGVELSALFFDLAAERNSRAYLLRAFDVAELDADAREEVRQQAEAMIVEVADSASEPREVPHGGVRAIERDLFGMSANGHTAVVRTLVWGEFVFQLVVLAPVGAGDAWEGRAFFDSLDAGRW